MEFILWPVDFFPLNPFNVQSDMLAALFRAVESSVKWRVKLDIIVVLIREDIIGYLISPRHATNFQLFSHLWQVLVDDDTYCQERETDSFCQNELKIN